jgi:hypothetical protein
VTALDTTPGRECFWSEREPTGLRVTLSDADFTDLPYGDRAFDLGIHDAPQLAGLEVGGLALGASRPFSVAGLDEPFMVYAGTVEATLSFMLIRNLGSTSLCVRVRYQACTEPECLPSASMSQEVVLEGLDLMRD